MVELPFVPDRLLALVGPTGSGKSTVAMRVAETCQAEIISCDSVQVYQGFEIGCAKPSEADRARVRHHLIDVAKWDDPFGIQQFREQVLEALDDIRSRGKQPLLCGGTGLYLRLLRWGQIDSPPADEALRARFEADQVQQPGCLYEQINEINGVTTVVK